VNLENLFKEYKEFTLQNRDVCYEIAVYPMEKDTDSQYQWVGGQIYADVLYAIPNFAKEFLKLYKNEKYEKFAELSNKTFKWTGGCIYKDKMYCLPRSSNGLLSLAFDTDENEEIPLGTDYKKEHHYGGVCFNGIVYQPPRENDHFLKIDLLRLDCSLITTKAFFQKNNLKRLICIIIRICPCLKLVKA